MFHGGFSHVTSWTGKMQQLKIFITFFFTFLTFIFRESELVVTVQGPRPDNILFLVHEVFEGLIAESFHGVQYDFQLPCPECCRMVS